MNDQLFGQYLSRCRERVESALAVILPEASIPPQRLHTAMRYVTLGPGKRVRPMLVYAAGEALSAPNERLDTPACAVELIHTYSLVHDDLPAMDNDDLRRGRKTCHREFDEATAILVGDALQSLAFRILASDKSPDLDAETRIDMIETLAIASGSRGMAGGQALDLAAIGREINLTELENMHIHKTGALIRASIRLGTLQAPESDPLQVRGLDHYAKCIGLAFQVVDDILDIAGDSQTLGKTSGKDQANDKPTYPALLGMEASRDMAERLREEALESIQSLDAKADPLRWLAGYIVERSR
ncbi:MAG: (2E,6E)-farnesyl diphosphate synthase [Gammaproteobacteria bacterium]|nr:(2E,6E)-farnesyl diphosphate synthase [Gammaproteobacteria bacterium]MCP5418703.1 (2E,6E)-farnesyl diphosphate synthase [Chromatiaceae bacterium]